MGHSKRYNQVQFQGKNKKHPYFEGWYFKFVTEDKKTSLALIPGITLDESNPHAFIQVMVSIEGQNPPLQTKYYAFPLEDFSYSDTPFSVTIKDQYFSLDKVVLDLEFITGEIVLKNITPIKTSWFSPNVMGPFAFIPNMECNHGVVSMRHDIYGKINLNHQNLDFSRGRGYIEKDYGISFPSEYIWLQSNHFSNEKVSFLFSVAKIPFHKFHFDGLISNLLIGEKEYRFASYNFTRMKKEVHSPNHVTIILKRGIYQLMIDASCLISENLKAPRNGKMNTEIKEGLIGQIHLILKKRNKVIFEDTGYPSGIEIMMK